MTAEEMQAKVEEVAATMEKEILVIIKSGPVSEQGRRGHIRDTQIAYLLVQIAAIKVELARLKFLSI